MAQCTVCRQKIKLGEFKDKRGSQKSIYCRDCAIKDDKSKAMEILGEGELQEHFRMEGVTMMDPYDPQRRIMCKGELVFAENGVCFVQVSDVQMPSNMYHQFGLIGMLLWNSKKKKIMKTASEELEQKQARYQDTPLEQLLEEADRYMVIPRDEIRQIKWSLGSMKIKTDSKARAFQLDGKKKAFQEQEMQIMQYMQPRRPA